jgi:hypothetical protein
MTLTENAFDIRLTIVLEKYSYLRIKLHNDDFMNLNITFLGYIIKSIHLFGYKKAFATIKTIRAEKLAFLI